MREKQKPSRAPFAEVRAGITTVLLFTRTPQSSGGRATSACRPRRHSRLGVPERRRLLAKLPFEHEGQPNGPDGEDCDDDRNDEQVLPAKAAIEADVGDEESH